MVISNEKADKLFVNMIQAVSSPTENAFNNSTIETPRRRSTFYVPLTIADIDDNSDSNKNSNQDDSNFKKERQKRSLDKIYKPDNACNYNWSLNESTDLMTSNDVELRTGVKRTASTSTGLFSTKIDRILSERPIKSNSTSEVNNRNKIKRYGIVLNGSVNLDDDEKLQINDENLCHDNDVDGGGGGGGDDDEQKSPSSTSTPIKLMKSRSRSNILCLPDKSFQLSPLKEKSKTLPQNLSPKVLTSASASNIAGTNASTFPPKYSFLLKSSPKISLSYSFDAVAAGTTSSPVCNSTMIISPPIIDKKSQSTMSPSSSSSPRKALSFIRRAHSTKLTRSNSLLKSLTSKSVDPNAENLLNHPVTELAFERFEECFKSDNFFAMIRELFMLKDNATANDSNCGLTSDSTAMTTVVDATKEPTENDKCDEEEVHSGKYH